MTDETENETVDGHPAQPCADTGLDAGDESDSVCCDRDIHQFNE